MDQRGKPGAPYNNFHATESKRKMSKRKGKEGPCATTLFTTRRFTRQSRSFVGYFGLYTYILSKVELYIYKRIIIEYSVVEESSVSAPYPKWARPIICILRTQLVPAPTTVEELSVWHNPHGPC
jgi:hypothetical protein